MEATEILDEADIVFSDSAASRVAQLIKEEKKSRIKAASIYYWGRMLWFFLWFHF